MAVVYKNRPDGKRCEEKDFEKKETVVRQVLLPQHSQGKEGTETAEHDTVTDADQADDCVVVHMPDVGGKENDQHYNFKKQADQRDHMDTVKAPPINIRLYFFIDGRVHKPNEFPNQFHNILNLLRNDIKGAGQNAAAFSAEQLRR
jgi:hypothetical protein